MKFGGNCLNRKGASGATRASGKENEIGSRIRGKTCLTFSRVRPSLVVAASLCRLLLTPEPPPRVCWGTCALVTGLHCKYLRLSYCGQSANADTMSSRWKVNRRATEGCCRSEGILDHIIPRVGRHAIPTTLSVGYVGGKVLIIPYLGHWPEGGGKSHSRTIIKGLTGLGLRRPKKNESMRTRSLPRGALLEEIAGGASLRGAARLVTRA